MSSPHEAGAQRASDRPRSVETEPNRRKVKLILPKVQLRLIGSFAAASMLSLGLQYLLFSQAVSALAADLPHDGMFVLERLPRVLFGVLLTTSALIFPVIAWIGLQTTFRIAGPLYRFERYLEAVVRGEETRACKLRSGDQLQELCRLINQSSLPMRERTEAARSAQEDGADEGPRAELPPIRRVA